MDESKTVDLTDSFVSYLASTEAQPNAYVGDDGRIRIREDVMRARRDRLAAELVGLDRFIAALESVGWDAKAAEEAMRED